MSDARDYILESSGAELERLRAQAQVWEPAAEAMLDLMGVPEGARVADLGCGAMGILGPLSRRVGAQGKVLGIDIDPVQLAGAHDYVATRGLGNTEILALDAYNTGLPAASLDQAHVRFVLAPVGRNQDLMREILRLVRPGGLVGIQEPDSCSWQCLPAHPAWSQLRRAILATFLAGGGDFDVGRRLPTLLREGGLEHVRMRTVTLDLPHPHPYRRLPLQFAHSLKQRMLSLRVLSPEEYDALTAECARLADDPEIGMLSFTVIQVWGRVPDGATPRVEPPLSLAERLRRRVGRGGRDGA
jgi:SAM-dependent methyltransferase